MDISVDVSDCQVVWINIRPASHDNWIYLAELVFLSRINWVLNLGAPSVLTFLIESLASSSEGCLWIVKSLPWSSELNIDVTSSVCTSILVFALLVCISRWHASKKSSSFIDRNLLESSSSIHLFCKEVSLILIKPSFVDSLRFSVLIICDWHVFVY